eukprot:7380242-Prymnesium_polylepis.1
MASSDAGERRRWTAAIKSSGHHGQQSSHQGAHGIERRGREAPLDGARGEALVEALGVRVLGSLEERHHAELQRRH